jgi:hypothetical protein
MKLREPGPIPTTLKHVLVGDVVEIRQDVTVERYDGLHSREVTTSLTTGICTGITEGPGLRKTWVISADCFADPDLSVSVIATLMSSTDRRLELLEHMRGEID